MTQYPGPSYPPHVPGYQTPSTPSAPARPTAVTVLAIFGIIFGALGVLCKPLGLLAVFVVLYLMRRRARLDREAGD